MLQGLAWSYSPSSKWCWSGRSRQSVGASFCFRPGVISFSWMAHFVRLYLHHIAVFSTYSPHVKALSSLTPCLHPTIITVRAALPGTFVSQRQSGHYAGLTIKLRHGSSDSSSNRHDMARPLIVRQKNRCAFGEECCGGGRGFTWWGLAGGLPSSRAAWRCRPPAPPSWRHPTCPRGWGTLCALLTSAQSTPSPAASALNP